METLKVKIKKLVSEASIPAYANPGDAGLDMKVISYKYDKELNCHVYGTGIAMEIPKGYVGLLFPRSSNRKTDCYLTNSVGVDDSSYRGEVMFSFKNRDSQYDGESFKPYEIGNKIGQLIIIPYPKIEFEEVKKLSETIRGAKGHGSSGN